MRHSALPPLLLSILLAAAAGAAPPGAAETLTTLRGTEFTAGGKLTLAEAVERALAFRPEVAAAQAERRRAEGAAAEVRATRLPTVDTLGSVAHYDEPVPVTPFHGFGAGTFPDFETTLVQASVRVGYILWEGGRRAGRVDQAEAEVAVADASLSDAEQGVVVRTVGAYLRVLTLGATLEAADARIEALRAERRRVEQLLGVGRAPEVDLRRAEAALAAAEAERVRLTTGLEAAEQELARQIGLHRSRPGRNPTPLRYGLLAPVTELHTVTPLPPRANLLRALESNPRMLAAVRRLAAAQASLRVAQRGHRPTLSAVSDLQELGSTAGTYEGEWSAGLQVAIPLFRGGALKAREARAKAARDSVAERLRATRLELETVLDDALAALNQARARREALQKAEKQYAEVARIERLRLETGVGLQADYLDAEADLLDARAGRIEAVHSEVAARVELAWLTGALDLNWIEEELDVSTADAKMSLDVGGGVVP